MCFWLFLCTFEEFAFLLKFSLDYVGAQNCQLHLTATCNYFLLNALRSLELSSTLVNSRSCFMIHVASRSITASVGSLNRLQAQLFTVQTMVEDHYQSLA